MRRFAPKAVAWIPAVVALGIAMAGGTVVAFGGTPHFFGQELALHPSATPLARPTPATAPITAPSPGPAPSDLVIADMEVPSLSDKEVTQAEGILLNRLSTLSLFEKSSYRISQIGPWLNEDFGVRGVSFVLSLSTPLPVTDVTGDWPYISADGSAPSGYRSRTMSLSKERASSEFAGRAVQRFSVLIDLRSNTVVELQPMIEDLTLTDLSPAASNPPSPMPAASDAP